jgi:hypothetical protein
MKGTVKELIQQLSKLDETLYVCGLQYESIDGVFSGVGPVEEADNGNDCLEEGIKYVHVSFGLHLKPPPPELKFIFTCSYCKATREATHPVSCKSCSWLPMMKSKDYDKHIKEKYG